MQDVIGLIKIILPVASNLGTFFGGIGTFVLGIVSCFGISSFDRLMKQKKIEKRSDIAEEALNGFDLFKNHLDEWMQFVDSCLIFNRNSQVNIQRFESLNEEGQRIFLEKCDKNPCELINYLKKGYSILDELSSVSSKAARLQDPFMVEQLEELRNEFKMMLGSVAAKHFSGADSIMKNKAINDIKIISERINSLCKLIQDNLIAFLMFKK